MGSLIRWSYGASEQVASVFLCVRVVAVVPLETFLFAASIHENMAIFWFTASSVTSVTPF